MTDFRQHLSYFKFEAYKYGSVGYEIEVEINGERIEHRDLYILDIQPYETEIEHLIRKAATALQEVLRKKANDQEAAHREGPHILPPPQA